MIKSYYAEKAGIDPASIVVVSVMPCTAKKYEAARPELGHDGLADVDVVITTREDVYKRQILSPIDLCKSDGIFPREVRLMLVNSQEKYAELDKVIAANKGQGGAVTVSYTHLSRI